MSKRFKRAQIAPQTINIQGEDYPVAFTLAALEAVETETDMPFMSFFTLMAEGKATPRQQVQFLRICLNAGGTEVSTEELLESLSLGDFAGAMQQISTVLTEQMPEAETEDKESKNPA